MSLENEEEELYSSVFADNFSRREFLALWKLGKTSHYPAGKQIIAPGEIPRSVFLLTCGTVSVQVHAASEIGTVPSPHFIGDMSYLLQNSASPAGTKSRKTFWFYSNLHIGR